MRVRDPLGGASLRPVLSWMGVKIAEDPGPTYVELVTLRGSPRARVRSNTTELGY